MRAIPWPEARKEGPISFDFLQQGVVRRERFWQNETKVRCQSWLRSVRQGAHGRTTDRLRADNGETKLSP
jgi:hypothetical protein